ncbi:MAG: NAD(+)/NADH kinase [Peptococcaceae bacterium]|jgi:NAD+ kinase|nr:NAD(+)/NADH kinase [Peptococcaceae bacterium]
MKKIGIWGNFSLAETVRVADQMETWLTERSCQVFRDWQAFEQEHVEGIISLGGDGTLLATAREAAIWEIPVLGINFGRLGFLCEIEREDIWEALASLLNGAYTIQQRAMLGVEIHTNGAPEVHKIALNDVVFAREAGESQIILQADISGEPSVRYPADGLIIATPTGSTAYSLSAGGPVVSPDVAGIIITPLAAHSLSARPMIVSQKEVIEITLARGKLCRVTCDGKYHLNIRPNDRALIRVSDLQARLIHLGTRSFPKIVREKLMDRWHDA